MKDLNKENGKTYKRIYDAIMKAYRPDDPKSVVCTILLKILITELMIQTRSCPKALKVLSDGVNEAVESMKEFGIEVDK